MICLALLMLPIVWLFAGCDGVWSTDYLAYVGAIVGSLTTLVAVSWQIREEAKARRAEHEQSVRPVISCDVDRNYEFHLFTFDHVSVRDIERKQQEELSLFREHDRQTRRVFIILSEDDEGKISCKEPDELDRIFFMEVHFDQRTEVFGDKANSVWSRYNVVPLVMRNVGVGPALRFQVSVNLAPQGREFKFRPPYTLGVKEDYHLVLCFDCDSLSLRNCSVDVMATYESIAGVQYRFPK